MDFDLDTLIKILDFAWGALVLVVGLFIRSLFARIDRIEKAHKEHAEAHKVDIEKLAAERARSIGELRDRLAQIEAIIDHTPTKDDFHKLSLSVAALSGDLKAMVEAMKPIGQSVARIDDYLMDKAK